MCGHVQLQLQGLHTSMKIVNGLRQYKLKLCSKACRYKVVVPELACRCSETQSPTAHIFTAQLTAEWHTEQPDTGVHTTDNNSTTNVHTSKEVHTHTHQTRVRVRARIHTSKQTAQCPPTVRSKKVAPVRTRLLVSSDSNDSDHTHTNDTRTTVQKKIPLYTRLLLYRE